LQYQQLEESTVMLHCLTDIQKLLCGNLKRLRKERNITQEALAELAGLSDGYIKQLETARTWISPDTVKKISEALECEEASLFADPGLAPTVQEALSILCKKLGLEANFKKKSK
jgi:transcriptional regulator with XRE-family HTH domain